MKTTIKEENELYVVYFDGRLDTAAAPETEKTVLPILEGKGRDIILDCSLLEYISSSGLRIFLSILKNAKTVDSKVRIRNISEEIRSVFAITGFTSLFEFI